MFVAVMHRYARRRGQSTILGISMRWYTEPCSSNLVFAKKNNDFLMTSILHENEVMRKHALRWGQSTIFGVTQTGAAAPCSWNPIFCKKKTDCILAQEVAYYRPKGGPQDAPRDRGRHFPDLDPIKPRDHAPKTIFFYKESQRFRVLQLWNSFNLDAKICTTLRPEHDFQKDA